MATLYDSGYGGDRGDLYGASNPQQEIERRRREQGQRQAQQTPYQVQAANEPAQPRAQQPPQQQNMQPPAQQQAQTFAQMQQAGQARPAPQAQMQPMQPVQAMQPMQPANGHQQIAAEYQRRMANATPEQQALSQQMAQQAESMGLDPIAAMMNPQGFQTYLQERGGAGGAPTGGVSLNETNYMDMVRVDPRTASSVAGGAAAPGPFTGDLGAFMAGQLNAAGQNNIALPTPYNASTALAPQLAALQNIQLPNAPTFRQDPRLVQQAQGLMGGGTAPAAAAPLLPAAGGRAAPVPTPAAAPAAAPAPSGVSAAGVDPLTAGWYRGTDYDANRMQFELQNLGDAIKLGTNPNTGVTGGGTSAFGGAQFLRAADGSVIMTGQQLSPGAQVDIPGVGQAKVVTQAEYDTALNGPKPAAAQSASPSDFDRLMREAYNTPSGFDNAEVQRLYNQMGQNIDDQFAQEQTALQEQMSARGLSDSSIMGGRMADLNVGRRSAREGLANQLLTQRAQDYAQQRNAVLGLGLQGQQQALQAELGRGGLDVSRMQAATQAELGRGNLGLGQQQLAAQREQNAAGNALNQQRFGLENLQFQSQLGQQDFANQLASADFGLRRGGQQFSQGLAGAQFQNQLGQQGFTNNMALADFQRGLGNDAFTQRMGYVDRLNQFGQQAFENDFRINEANRLAQADYDRYLSGLIGLGG